MDNLSELKLRNFELVSLILGAEERKNEYVEKFEELKKNDFNDFCNKVTSGSFITNNQIEDIDALNKVLSEMQLIANFPALHSKHVGAIGGGFSAGKSCFINSLMKDSNISLAEGIMPVTAIPSYVICGNESKIQGISSSGAVFDMEVEMYKSISHEMMKTFKFDLKKILKYITVIGKMDSELFENICLIDTPGYNPPSIGTKALDKEISKQYIKDADFLIWLVGLDSNGTINKADLDYLKELPFGHEEGKLLYVVANKCKSKNPSARQKVLETVCNTLEDEDISFEGVSIYDSKDKQEYLFEKCSLFEFIKNQNKSTKIYYSLGEPLNEVFNRYKIAIEYDFKTRSEKRKEIRNMIFDGYEKNRINVNSIDDKLKTGLQELERFFKPKDKEASLKLLEEIKNKFFECLNDFCTNMGIEILDITPEKQEEQTSENNQEVISIPKKVNNFCQRCGTRLKPQDKFCTHCGKQI